MIVRDARPEELPGIGDLRVTAYRTDGFLTAASRYTPTLRALGADGAGEVLAAVDGGRVVGTVMLMYWPAGNMVRGPGEAEVRALAVAPEARGRGTGRMLVGAAIDRATRRGVRHLLLVTLPGMHAAQRLYTGAGFARLPERDRWRADGEDLLAYGLPLSH